MAAFSSKPRMSFNVFVCYGKDVRNSFVGHLYAALDQSGIFSYKDIEEKRKGELAPVEILCAIEESNVAIIVFSKDFASSRWCLEPMVKIMELQAYKDLIVLPVFYQVEAREVRTWREIYGEAIAKHEVKFGNDSERWKEALFNAGGLSGWHLKDGISEAEVIMDIVKTVSELKRFDVFLSFRGKDVRENFIESLNETLVQKNIKTFMGSENLVKGEDFPPKLKDAVEQSRIYVVVFSKNYAESLWCLKELVLILERKNRRKHPMLPIFYQVAPWEVSGQKESYGKALAKHEIPYGTLKVKKWKDALSEAANVNGIHLSDGNIDGWIPHIVEEIKKIMAESRSKQG